MAVWDAVTGLVNKAKGAITEVNANFKPEPETQAAVDKVTNAIDSLASLTKSAADKVGGLVKGMGISSLTGGSDAEVTQSAQTLTASQPTVKAGGHKQVERAAAMAEWTVDLHGAKGVEAQTTSWREKFAANAPGVVPSAGTPEGARGG